MWPIRRHPTEPVRIASERLRAFAEDVLGTGCAPQALTRSAGLASWAGRVYAVEP